MPYISKESRKEITKNGYLLSHNSCGDLNYLFTLVINDYLNSRKLTYQVINDIIGALEGSKLEFYRRIVIPYENSKIALNGDVYTNENNSLDSYEIDLGGS